MDGGCSSKVNPALTVVSSNCTDFLVCHEIGLWFNSPFVNLWIHPHDFVRLVDDLEGYMDVPLRFVKEDQVKYPVAILKDVRIYFQHYKSEEYLMNIKLSSPIKNIRNLSLHIT